MLKKVWLVAILVLAVAVMTIVIRNDAPKAPSLSGPRPGTLAVETIGTSLEGREIEAVSLGTGPSTVLVIGGLHTGEENVAADLAEQLARYFGQHVKELPSAVRLVVVPRANPDGYANDTRVNANGVDLNRNWPTDDWAPGALHGEEVVSGGDAPLSEPETRALYNYIDTLSPDVVISLHGFGAVVEPNDSDEAKALAKSYAKAAGYKLIEDWTYYEITGELIESMNGLQTAAFDVELREGAKNTFAKNLAGLKATLRAVAKADARAFSK